MNVSYHRYAPTVLNVFRSDDGRERAFRRAMDRMIHDELSACATINDLPFANRFADECWALAREFRVSPEWSMNPGSPFQQFYNSLVERINVAYFLEAGKRHA